MTRGAIVRQFISEIYDVWEDDMTQKDAYYALEKKYIEETGSRVFKNYASFKSSKGYHHKMRSSRRV